MQIEPIFKQFKHIRPDPSYATRSRFLILGDILPRASRVNAWQLLVQSIQTGGAVALVGVLLIVAVGGFSTWKFLNPFRVASLDPAGLTAEAQAIDIQILLTDVEYPEPATNEVSTPTVAPASAAKHADPLKKLAQQLGLETEAPTSSEPQPTIDDALDALGN